jgi:hypothetical protein
MQDDAKGLLKFLLIAIVRRLARLPTLGFFLPG